jgi:hypothetical protein
MKQSPQFLRKTLRHASALQARYKALGAPSTQNIRNPLPMHKLVLGVLNKLPDPNQIVPVTIDTRFTFHGKQFVVQSKGFEYAKDILPRAQWEKKGKTVQSVVADLQRLGYIVAKPSTVAMALSKGARHDKIASVRHSTPGGGRGNTRSLYFIAE